MTDTNQQTNLALNISETIINLHRPYYAKTLYDVDNVDNIESVYKHSFYTIIERCAVWDKPIRLPPRNSDLYADYNWYCRRYP